MYLFKHRHCFEIICIVANTCNRLWPCIILACWAIKYMYELNYIFNHINLNYARYFVKVCNFYPLEFHRDNITMNCSDVLRVSQRNFTLSNCVNLYFACLFICYFIARFFINRTNCLASSQRNNVEFISHI